MKNTLSTHPIHCNRGVPQGDPISMFAVAAALGCWLEALETIPRHIHTEARVFVDDRLLAEKTHVTPSWIGEAFHATCRWDTSWSSLRDLKRSPLSLALTLQVPNWPDGTRVSLDATPIYLGVPLPVPQFSRTSYFDPILSECRYILDRVLHNKFCTTLSSRR